MSSFGGGGDGINFIEPWKLLPYTATVANLAVYDSAGAGKDASEVAFFTEIARRGAIDTTNWAADTYKTILSVTSGKGLVAAILGCTMGGAETTTFRITIDGIASTVAITGASGKRACLLARNGITAEFTTVSEYLYPGAETLAADKATFSATYAGAYIPPWRVMSASAMLTFKRSLLIEAKHSANITNSTATAYSAVMYRLGL